MRRCGDTGIRWYGGWLGVLGGVASLLLSIAAAAADAPAIVTQEVQATGSHEQAAVPVTFGQVFKAGDVPRGMTVTATLVGQSVTVQVDRKATNPDGSLRHAVLTVMVPKLAPRAQLPLVLAAAPQAAAVTQDRAVSLAQVLATGYDAKAEFNLGAKVYTADARALLQAAARSHACKPWGKECNLWLAGPLTSAWVVHGRAQTADGATTPHLDVYFAVRAYAGVEPGTVGRVRTDIVIENTDAFAPQGQPQYTATLTSGSATYTSPALTQYAYTRWHHVLWWNDAEPDAYVQQDTQYLQASKAVSRYMKLQPDAKFLASVRQSCAPLDHCDQTQYMGQTGAQPAIGPLPRWTSVYIVNPDVRAYRWMLANNDALGAYSIHYRDAATGYPVSIQRHPYATIVNWASAHRLAAQQSADARRYRADLLPSCTNNAVVANCNRDWYATGNPNVWDAAHQPAESYVPYLVTGSWYYLSELAFGASHNGFRSNEGYRGHAQGLIGPAYSQIRAKAWVLREMANAAWLLPDSYPLKAEFRAEVRNSIEYWNRNLVHRQGGNLLHVLDVGTVYSVHGGSHNAMAPWQHNFLTWSVGHAAELGFAGADVLRAWLAAFEIQTMTRWQSDGVTGYCWLQASAYNLIVKQPDGHWMPSLNDAYAATFPELAGVECNSHKMVSILSVHWKQRWQLGQMLGYAYSATGFPANLQIGLAAAADSGLPQAHDAWAIFASRSVKPYGARSANPDEEYRNYPNFAVVPRTVPP